MKLNFVFLTGILFVVVELTYCKDDEKKKENVEKCLKDRGVDKKKFEDETVACAKDAAQENDWSKKFCDELKETEMPPCFDKDTLQHLEECVKNESPDASFTKELVDYFKRLCGVSHKNR